MSVFDIMTPPRAYDQNGAIKFTNQTSCSKQSDIDLLFSFLASDSQPICSQFLCCPLISLPCFIYLLER